MARKTGSVNRRSLMVLPMLEALGYRDPAVVLGEFASMPAARLKKLMASEAGRASVAARLKAAAELMPYCHSKMAVKVDIGGDLPIFQIFGDRDQIEIEQNQGLTLPAPGDVGRDDVGRQADLIEVIEQSGERTDD